MTNKDYFIRKYVALFMAGCVMIISLTATAMAQGIL
jgi:hypothetical protein